MKDSSGRYPEWILTPSKDDPEWLTRYRQKRIREIEEARRGERTWAERARQIRALPLLNLFERVVRATSRRLANCHDPEDHLVFMEFARRCSTGPN